MKTKTKIWIVIATAFIVVGGILFVGVMSKLNWDFTKLSTFKHQTNTYEISDAFENISINTDTAEVEFKTTDSENCIVECYEEEKVKHEVMVENNTLTIKIVDSRKWYEYVGINFDSTKITIYLPLTQYGSLFIESETSDVEISNDFTFKDVDISLSTGEVDFCANVTDAIKIETSTGDISIEDITAGSLDLTVSTGEVEVSNVKCEGDVLVGVSTGKTYLSDTKCKKIISKGSTGDIYINNVTALELFSIERSTGDVKIENSDATEIFIKTDTGDVFGSLLTEKVFITRSGTGKIIVPSSVNGGRCEIITSTGNIRFTINN